MVEQKHLDALEYAQLQCVWTDHTPALNELPALIRAMQAENEEMRAFIRCYIDPVCFAVPKVTDAIDRFCSHLAATPPQAAAALTLSTKTLQQVALETCDEVIDRKNPRYVFTPDDLLVFVAALQESRHLQAAAPVVEGLSEDIDRLALDVMEEVIEIYNDDAFGVSQRNAKIKNRIYDAIEAAVEGRV